MTYKCRLLYFNWITEQKEVFYRLRNSYMPKQKTFKNSWKCVNLHMYTKRNHNASKYGINRLISLTFPPAKITELLKKKTIPRKNMSLALIQEAWSRICSNLTFQIIIFTNECVVNIQVYLPIISQNLNARCQVVSEIEPF